MKLLLTSFGLSNLNGRMDRERPFFHGMPPAILNPTKGHFVPDLSALLLAEKFVINSETFQYFTKGGNSKFRDFEILLKSLEDAGMLEISNFESIVDSNKALLEKMLDVDLKELEIWVKPFIESIEIWNNISSEFTEELKKNILSETEVNSNIDQSFLLHSHLHFTRSITARKYGEMQLLHEALALSSNRRKKAYRMVLSKYLAEYISYVNTNLLLSEKTNSGIYDWKDFLPFYEQKFLRLAKNMAPGMEQIKHIKNLFEVSFPRFAPTNIKSAIKALTDDRIIELRKLIDSACSGEVEFDHEFAQRTLYDVTKINSRVHKIRTRVSYITLPLGFIPIYGSAVQKLAEESASRILDKKEKKGYNWFYLISEVGSSQP